MVFYLDEKTHISKISVNLDTFDHTLITATSGQGKTILSESILHRLWKQGAVIISITDVKDEFELPFCQFLPEAQYHKDKLRKWGIPEETIPIKVYHPFSFNIPNEKLPEYELYTIPIKSLTRTELQYIAESKTDKTSIKMFLEAIQKLRKDEGIHHLIWTIQKMTEGETGKNKYSTDPNEFFAKGSKGGTEKQISEIIGYFNPFKTDYTLTPEDCKLNIDIKKIINDKEHYHQLSTKYIKDDKQKGFYILNFIRQIKDTLTDHAKYPIILYIDEMAIVFPQETEGHTVILSEVLGRDIKQLRSKGRGTIILGCAQEYFKVNNEITGSMVDKIFGQLSIQDIGNINRYINIKSEGIQQIRTLKTGEFLNEKLGFTTPWKAWMPPHAHKERKYKYVELYREKYPERMRQYTEEKKYIKEIKNAIENDVRNIVEKENLEAKKQEQQKAEAKINKTTEIKEKLTQIKAEKQELNEQRKKEIYNKWKEYKAIGTPKSYREIAKEYNIYLKSGEADAKTIQRIINKYQEQEEEQT